MDDVLRRRLVGAAVLLTAAFVVASLLPDPQPRTARAPAVVTYDLRTGKPVRDVPPAEAAAPAKGSEAESVPEAPPEPVARPTLKVDETLDGGAGEWYVQVGSFESQANARKVLQKLYGLGMPTVIQSVAVGKGLWYRVRVGPYPTEAPAAAALATIRKQGYNTAKLVRPETAPAKGGN